MSESSYPVGYGRPPQHTRFRKGQSGNPGGRPGPKKRLKHQFDKALSDALEGDRWELLDARPARVIEALARKMILDALDRRSSAQRLVLGILDSEDPAAADEITDEDQGAADEQNCEERVTVDEGRENQSVPRDERDGVEAPDDDEDEEQEEEEEEEIGEEDRFVFDGGEDLRARLGDRYDEYKRRIERAVDTCNVDDLAEVFEEMEFGDKFPQSGNS
jgi:hypothetical protein